MKWLVFVCPCGPTDWGEWLTAQRRLLASSLAFVDFLILFSVHPECVTRARRTLHSLYRVECRVGLYYSRTWFPWINAYALLHHDDYDRFDGMFFRRTWCRLYPRLSSM